MPLFRLLRHEFQEKIESLLHARALRRTEYARLFAGAGLYLYAFYNASEVERAGAPPLRLPARGKENVTQLDAAERGSRRRLLRLLRRCILCACEAAENTRQRYDE
jgi:hypothetical protein